MTLDQCKCNETVLITHLIGASPFRRRLMEMGLVPDTNVTILKAAPFRDPIEIFFKNCRCILSKNEASLIEVRSQLK